jgi:predicted ATPase
MGSGLRSKNYLIGATLLRDQVPSFDEYPFNIPAIRHLSELEFDQPVTFLVGENGSGKSTLLEALAVAWGFNPEGGSRNFSFSTRESHSVLHRFVRLIRPSGRVHDGFFLRAESFFNVAAQVEQLGVTGYGDRSLHEQSHGESFFALFDNRFRGGGLYMLDEPEAALSPNRQLAFLTRLHEIVGVESQFIIATHSPIILAYPDAWIYQATPQGLERVEYEDTEHFQVTRGFLNRRETFLKILLADEDEDDAPDEAG